MIRFLDIIASIMGLIVLSPLFLIIAIWIKLDDSEGPVFYRQTRVGKDNADFLLYKFRSMRVGSDSKGLITIGGHDARITRSGYFMRKFKIDELPQLINVLKGEMSLVGPRPEVRKYVDMYNEEQRKVLSVRPGVTDYASIEYLDENTLLALSANPDKTYIEEIMPAKIKLNMRYIEHRTVFEYIKVIFMTILGISYAKPLNWYVSKASVPYWSIMILDLTIILFQTIIGYAIVHGRFELARDFWQVVAEIVIYLPIFSITGKVFHMFDLQAAHTVFTDLRRIFGTMLSGALIASLIAEYLHKSDNGWSLDWGTMCVGSLLTAVFMLLARVIVRAIYAYDKTRGRAARAVIYGTMENINVLTEAVQNQRDSLYNVYGYMTDERSDSLQHILGKKMFIKSKNIVARLAGENVKALICGPIMGEAIKKNREFVTQLKNAGIDILVLQDITSLVRNARGSNSNLPLCPLDVN